MLKHLDFYLPILPSLLQDQSVWGSLIVNRRKPHTYRVFTNLRQEGLRICLHKFDPCDTHEAFAHPHPWPGAFMVMKGSYKMKVGYFHEGKSSEKNSEVAEFVLTKHSRYEIVNPLTWHSVIPLETTYTIMINGEPWNQETAHKDVRTTKGKDLDKMPENELLEHLAIFENLIKDYLNSSQK